MESKREPIAIGIWIAICRTVLSSTFIFSGFVKANDLLGSQYKIQEYVALLGEGIFPSLSFASGLLQGIVEFCLGVYLLFGIRRKVSSFLVFLIMLFMTPLTLWLAIDNPIADCGCFGDALHLSNWETFGKNLFLLIAAYSLAKWHRRITPFITSRFDWMVSLYTFLYITLFALYAYRQLPPIDFRPFHIGVNIAKAMEIPPGVKPTQYETRFLLEKEGVEKEFTLENYPDSSWRFVDSKTVVAEKGYEPTIHDFTIITQQDGFDITDEVLQDSSYTFLLVMHQVELADDSRIDLLNEIYDYSLDYGYNFYALTASGDEDIFTWKERTGAEYPFCTMDDITLKTMIRSNPGLLLLKNGVIINKWSVNNLPDEYQLTDRLERLPLGEINQRSLMHKLGLLFAWFIIPLLLVAFIDLVWERIKRRGERIKNGYTFTNPIKNKKMRKNIVAGNWKMNKNLQEGIALAKELNEALVADKPNCDVVICTPFIHLASVTPIVDSSIIGVGAENCADKVSGAYTGEISAEMVASTGASYVILGHSERRAYYGETVAILEEKTKLALANGLTPLFCIGEVLEEREANKQNEVVAAQLASVFTLSAEDFAKIVLAYEPVWAIGTGKTATAAQAQEIHAFIRSLIVEKYGQEIADNTSILYGGSCNPTNAAELFANPDVDGGLIGGAALSVANFKGIIDAFK